MATCLPPSILRPSFFPIGRVARRISWIGWLDESAALCAQTHNFLCAWASSPLLSLDCLHSRSPPSHSFLILSTFILSHVFRFPTTHPQSLLIDSCPSSPDTAAGLRPSSCPLPCLHKNPLLSLIFGSAPLHSLDSQSLRLVRANRCCDALAPTDPTPFSGSDNSNTATLRWQQTLLHQTPRCLLSRKGGCKSCKWYGPKDILTMFHQLALLTDALNRLTWALAAGSTSQRSTTQRNSQESS